MIELVDPIIASDYFWLIMLTGLLSYANTWVGHCSVRNAEVDPQPNKYTYIPFEFAVKRPH